MRSGHNVCTVENLELERGVFRVDSQTRHCLLLGHYCPTLGPTRSPCEESHPYNVPAIERARKKSRSASDGVPCPGLNAKRSAVRLSIHIPVNDAAQP